MDVDDAARIAGDEIRRQHLHVARQHDEIDPAFRRAAPAACVRPPPCCTSRPARGGTECRGTRPAGARPGGCRSPAGCRRRARRSGAGAAGPPGSAGSGKRRSPCEGRAAEYSIRQRISNRLAIGLKCRGEGAGRQVEIGQRPLHPHKEQPQVVVLVLVGVQDVGPVVVKEIRRSRRQCLSGPGSRLIIWLCFRYTPVYLERASGRQRNWPAA